MSGYSISLFLHLLGVISLFAASIATHAIGSRLRRAETVQEVRLWLGLARGIQPLFPIGGFLLLLTGLHLTGSVWDFRQPWIVVALVVLAATLPAGPLLQRPRFMAMGMAAGKAQPGPVTPQITAAVLNPFPWRFLSMTTGAALGLLWLMTVKPGWVGSVVPVVVLSAIGWFVGGAQVARDREARSAKEPVASATR